MEPLPPIRSAERARVGSTEPTNRVRRRGSREEDYRQSRRGREPSEPDEGDRFEPSTRSSEE